MNRPLTSQRKQFLLRKLADFRARGVDIEEALDHSTMHDWLDIYDPQEQEAFRSEQEERIRRAQTMRM